MEFGELLSFLCQSKRAEELMLRRIDKVSKKAVKEAIRAVLKKKHEEILFAYLHGSFVKKDAFHDIDVAIYLKRMPASVLEYELQMETDLLEALRKYIVDVRVLNGAPLSFKYNVIKDGIVLLSKDDDKGQILRRKLIKVSSVLDLVHNLVYIITNGGV